MTDAIALTPDDASNRELVEQVHPADWTNPEPADRYNLVVMGGGTSGLVAAIGAAGLGARVALVEEHLLGGDCLNFGCVPSKALLAAAQRAQDVRTGGELGVHAGRVRVDAAEALSRMRRLRATIAPHDGASRIRDAGVDVFLGRGAFEGEDAIRVGEARLRFRRALIATGGRPVVPPVPGLREAEPHTSDTLFGLEDAPRHLLVLGAGPIGCEMAQAFGRLGSRVTLVEAADRPLPREDPDASRALAERLRAEGVDLRTGHTLKEVRREGDERRMVLATPDGERVEVAGTEILVAVGRRPNLETLGLEQAGVERDERGGLRSDPRLRTTNPRIFAAGDVTGRFQFTHAADAMARIVLRNAFFFGRGRADRLAVPRATYTNPTVAHVGLDAAEAEQAGLSTFTVRLSGVDRAILEGVTEGFGRIHVDRKGRVRGATFVGPHAGDLIGEAALAVTKGLRASDLSDTIHPYPTLGEVWRQLGDAWQRSRLTPGAKRWFERWFRWRR